VALRTPGDARPGPLVAAQGRGRDLPRVLEDVWDNRAIARFRFVTLSCAALIRPVRNRRLLLLLGCATAALWLLVCASAMASPWAQTNLNLGPEETIFGMDCQAGGLCVGVGQEGVVITSAAPTGGVAAWSISHLSLAEDLRGNLRGISCPSASLCVAVDFSGGVWTTTEPAAGAAAWTPTRIPKARSLFGVSCSSTAQCVLVGLNGLVISSSDPTGGAAAWTSVQLSESPSLHSVVCSGPSLCVAGTMDGSLYTTTEPARGAVAWAPTVQPDGENPLLGVACQSSSLCVAGNSGNVLVSTAPTAGSAAWPATPLAARFQILAASCPSATLCVLSSNNGEVTATTNPLGGSPAWLTEHLIKGVTNALFGLSCPSEVLCVAAGKFGQLLTTIDPAATGLPAPPPPPPPPGTRLLGPRRRLIRLGLHQRPPVVSFRFGAIGSAIFYRCQLDRRPSGLCNSPRRYRVGVGPHTFRVRAFGAGGGDPTPAVFRFRVLRVTPKKAPGSRRGKAPQRAART
jgi:hypothetical protein